MVQLLIRSPVLLSVHSTHRPAITIWLSSAIATAYGCFGFLPLVEPVGDDQAALTLLPGVAECGRSIDRLCACVDRGEADLDVLRPPRNEPPPHLLRDALAVLTANGHQHRIGRAHVPRRRNVRSRIVRVELQLDPRFRVVRREPSTSTHGPNIWARLPGSRPRGVIADGVASLRCHSCLIDGEAVACDDQGIPDFKLLIRDRKYARPNSTLLISWNSTVRTCATSQLKRAN